MPYSANQRRAAQRFSILDSEASLSNSSPRKSFMTISWPSCTYRFFPLFVSTSNQFGHGPLPKAACALAAASSPESVFLRHFPLISMISQGFVSRLSLTAVGTDDKPVPNLYFGQIASPRVSPLSSIRASELSAGVPCTGNLSEILLSTCLPAFKRGKLATVRLRRGYASNFNNFNNSPTNFGYTRLCGF